jgi:hypothetical protein
MQLTGAGLSCAHFAQTINTLTDACRLGAAGVPESIVAGSSFTVQVTMATQAGDSVCMGQPDPCGPTCLPDATIPTDYADFKASATPQGDGGGGRAQCNAARMLMRA